MLNFYILLTVCILLIFLLQLFIYNEFRQKNKFRVLVQKEQELNKKLQNTNRELEESEYEILLLNESLESKVKEEVQKNIEIKSNYSSQKN